MVEVLQVGTVAYVPWGFVQVAGRGALLGVVMKVHLKLEEIPCIT